MVKRMKYLLIFIYWHFIVKYIGYYFNIIFITH